MDLMSLATSGGQAEGGRYERLRTLRARSSKVRPAKGGSPSTISYSVVPSDQTSTAGVSAASRPLTESQSYPVSCGSKRKG